MSVGLDDVPLVIEALRAYAPQLQADAAAERVGWLAKLFEAEAARAAGLGDALLGQLRDACQRPS